MENKPCGAPYYGQFLQKIKERIPQDRIFLHTPMSEHTTLRIGGPADMLVRAQSAQEISFLVTYANEFRIPVMMLGNGSNLLVKDGGIRGLVINFGEEMAVISVEGTVLTAKAGASLAAVAKEAARHSLSGLCYACGIPGTVGGGVYMNAGAYGGELKEAIAEVEAVSEDGQIRTYTGDEMHFGYRHSRAQEEMLIITSVKFQLAPGDKEAILSDMKEFNRRRNEKQPMDVPSAGSTFKRPEGYFAGQLIDQAGLRGARVGGAQVSEKHAGFLVNTGNATAEDFLNLISLVQRTVQEKHGVWLTPEVRIVGEDSPMHLV
jgi:UDP-N-acetylmuramate dehydrogenase